MEEKELILKLKELNQIKPRKEWAVLAKSEIFEGKAENRTIKTKIPVIPSFKFQIPNIFARKLAYAFAAFLFVVAGLAGFALDTSVLQEKSVASLSETMSTEQNLTQQINESIKTIAKQVKENPKQDFATIEKITKVLAMVSGSELTAESQDVADLYQIIVETQIADFDKLTLTSEQEKVLEKAKKLYKEERYLEAFEEVLFIRR
jgi:hypothetical protein